MTASLSNYLSWLTAPFFRWWWAAVTGAASLIAFAWTPQTVSISKPFMLAILLVVSTLLFFALTVTLQGWRLYASRTRFEILNFLRDKNQDLGFEWVMTFRGPPGVDVDRVLQVNRLFDDGRVIPFAIVKVLGLNDDSIYQAVPVWLSPGNLNDFVNHEFTARALSVGTHPTISTLEHYAQVEMERRSNG
jgi:hypothetical protein